MSIALRTTPDARQVLSRCRELVRPRLREAVGRLHPWVGEMAAYSLGWCEVGGAPADASGGKGVRQALAVLGAEAVGADGRAGVPGAVAAELLHVFSLTHDDIMDGDRSRRGRPTAWEAYGTGPALLSGDALFALAVETLADTAQGPSAVRLLARTMGDLVHGQADDLQFAGRPWSGPGQVRPEEYRAMVERKTGALLGGSLALGALLGGAPSAVAATLDRAGRHLGVAFQIVDDVLGIWGDPDVTGKAVHADLRERKKTLPVLLALRTAPLAGLLESGARPEEVAARVEEAGGRSGALAEAHHQIATANTLLTELPLKPAPLDELRTLLQFLTTRDM
ncbi:polyprenyl synthetase family protein [Streptomyces sp. NPDC090106]|uniref:polyprenyl synthetase family protein n=1 Tax=Streptomyces sp. NPDC090106 TaxID=3365946 RepID=UPI003804C65B